MGKSHEEKNISQYMLLTTFVKKPSFKGFKKHDFYEVAITLGTQVGS